VLAPFAYRVGKFRRQDLQRLVAELKVAFFPHPRADQRLFLRIGHRLLRRFAPGFTAGQ